MGRVNRGLLFLALLCASVYAGMFQSVPEEKAVLLKPGKEKRACSNCGMDLVMFYKTSHAVKLKDGGVKQYCSMHCLSADNVYAGNESSVVDTNSLQLISVQNSYYVVGSSKSGTMSRVSKYAFASKEEADAFCAEFGGKVMRFAEAVKIAKDELR